jgi:Flp pilus assembly protein TadD
LTLERIPVWRNAKTLWSDCVAKNPRSTIGHFSLAGVAIAENDLPTAEAHLRTAIKLKPDFADAHARLGAVLMLEGKRDEARAELRRALELEPDLTEARHNLSLLGE